MSKKNKAAKAEGSTLAAIAAIGSGMAEQAAAQGLVQDATQPAQQATNKFVAMSTSAQPVVIDNEAYATYNKRALAVALYLMCCERIGVKPSAQDTRAIRLCARLLPYANTGYSKHKQHMLKGSEVTASGMLGYAKFAVKPEGVKMYPGNDAHNKVQQVSKLATHIYSTYADIEGATIAPLASK